MTTGSRPGWTRSSHFTPATETAEGRILEFEDRRSSCRLLPTGQRSGRGGDHMYKVDLGESYFPAQTDDVVMETMVGAVLRAAAATTPGAEALVEADLAGELRRHWTYAELLADAERLARALLSR